MADGRALFEALRRGEPLSRPLRLPLVEALAPRVAGIDPAALPGDPAAWAGAVRQAAALVGGDAVTFGFLPDVTLAALSDGAGGVRAEPDASGLFGAFLDTLRQAFPPARGQSGCVAALVGPVSAALLLRGRADKDALEAVRPGLTRMVELVAEARPDLLVFLEAEPARAVPIDGVTRRAYASLRRVAAYYDVATAILSKGWEDGGAEAARLAPLNLDVLWLGPDSGGGCGPTAGTAVAAPGWRGVVVPVDWQDPSAAEALAGAAWAARVAGGAQVMLSAPAPLAADADLDAIQKTKAALAALAS